MKKNMGKVDRIIRSIVALATVYLGVAYSPWFFLLTAILAYTAFTNTCPLYAGLGISTIKKK